MTDTGSSKGWIIVNNNNNTQRRSALGFVYNQGVHIPPLFYTGTEINDFRDGFVRGLPPIRWAMFIGIAVRYALPTHRLAEIHWVQTYGQTETL